MVTVTLSKPVTVGEGDTAKTISSVSMDLEALTGGDIEFCVREGVVAKGEPIVVHKIDLEFHAQVVAKLSGISREGLRCLPVRDYEALLGPVESFFLGLD